MPESPIPELLRALAEEFDTLLAQLEPEKASKLAEKRKKRMPESDEAKALHRVFNRREGTLWSKKEIAAFVAAKDTGLLTLENIELIGWFRSVELPKGEQGFCRRSLEALLNNFGSEVDKANNCPERRRKAKASEPAPSKIVEMPRTSDEERVRLAAEAAKLSEQLRKGAS